MTLDLDDLPFIQPSEDEMTWVTPRKPAKCKHPKHLRRSLESGGVACTGCGSDLDPVRLRRGRTNRSRGNAIERQVAAELGLRRVGQFGGPEDVSGEWLTVQVKSGGSFPERIWRWLQALPANAGQTRAVVVTDAPGPGHRRRAIVVVDLADWIALHGEKT